MKTSLAFVTLSLSAFLASCNEGSRPAKMQAVSSSSGQRQSADNSPVRFTLIKSKFQRCEQAPEGMAAKGLRKTFVFVSDHEIELTLEMTPDLDCKFRFTPAELDAMQGQARVAGRYEKTSSLEGRFTLERGDTESADPGAYKVSGMSLKISPSSDLSNPDTYLFIP